MTIAGRHGVVRAAIIKGKAPLLISRIALKKIGAVMDFSKDELRVFGKAIPMSTNEAGQYMIPVTSFSVKGESPTPFVAAAIHKDEKVNSALSVDSEKHVVAEDVWEVQQDGKVVVRHHRVPRRDRFTPSATGCPIPAATE